MSLKTPLLNEYIAHLLLQKCIVPKDVRLDVIVLAKQVGRKRHYNFNQSFKTRSITSWIKNLGYLLFIINLKEFVCLFKLGNN